VVASRHYWDNREEIDALLVDLKPVKVGTRSECFSIAEAGSSLLACVDTSLSGYITRQGSRLSSNGKMLQKRRKPCSRRILLNRPGHHRAPSENQSEKRITAAASTQNQPENLVNLTSGPCRHVLDELPNLARERMICGHSRAL
jgi:hypothetical protein